MSHPSQTPALSLVLVALMKGILSRENDAALWQSLLTIQSAARDHVGVLGLELILDESEGYAYLRQSTVQDGDFPLPRLVPRRQLGFQVSLLLALLRKKLAEFDATSGDTRLVLEREQIADMIRVFLPVATNEARLADQIDGQISKIVDMGFLRRLRGHQVHGEQFEVRRILKAFVDAQWLADFDARLAAYQDHAAVSQDDVDGDVR